MIGSYHFHFFKRPVRLKLADIDARHESQENRFESLIVLNRHSIQPTQLRLGNRMSKPHGIPIDGKPDTPLCIECILNPPARGSIEHYSYFTETLPTFGARFYTP
jgi:hypothetical protein